MDSLLGLSTDLWPIIHRLSHLQSYKESLEAAVAAGETAKATVLRMELDSTSSAIELALTEWSPTLAQPYQGESSDNFYAQDTGENARVDSIFNNAEAYRHSAFVYLYRTIRLFSRDHPQVQKHAHIALVACSNVVIRAEECYDGPMAALTWPLFVAACEAVTEEDRGLAILSFGGIERRQGMTNIVRAWEVVQEVWRRADGGQAVVDWRQICDERCFTLVFG